MGVPGGGVVWNVYVCVFMYAMRAIGHGSGEAKEQGSIVFPG